LDHEDDDTTTIQSHDSVTGAGLLDTTDDGDETHEFLHPPSNIHRSTIPIISSNGMMELTSSVCSASTAPSTDEASSIGQDLVNYLSDTTSRVAQTHRRHLSWEVLPHIHEQQQSGGRVSPAAFQLPPAFSPTTGWSHTGNHNAEQRQQQYPLGPRLNATANNWNHSQGNVTRSGGSSSEPSSPRGLNHRQQVNMNHYPFPLQQLRRPHHQPPLPPSLANTPPRMNANTHDRITRNIAHNNALHPSQSPHRSVQPQHGSNLTVINGGGNSRSPSEVLKTLLRKKACLYEPDTSRAVALATWLVGRELALEFGYFSRQQLQAGVHACVSSKIDSGVITRTKVNRCMQIILNSCFHYIIPRSDGTEENGESMRVIFSQLTKDDEHLISILPPPWNDIIIDKQAILAACEEDMESQKHPKKYETPQSSPRLGSVQAMGSPGGGDSVDGDFDAKRAVLLCFNENVRSAEQVFRCHNEFIRDTAHACHLQLSSNEWRLFFGKEASSAKRLWGNVGIPVPHLDCDGPQQADALGMLTTGEAGVFRTSWCSKRYDHEHELCGFGHVEVNGGWLRRNPLTQNYWAELCQYVSVSQTTSESNAVKYVVVNECPYGTNCTFSHSREEIKYHPRRYKQAACISLTRGSGCSLGDVCSDFHPIESYRFPKKFDSRSTRHTRQSLPQSSSAGEKGFNVAPHAPASYPTPDGSPILYASPAPVSSYEEHLLLPGLQALYRRNCMFTRDNLRRQQIGASTCRPYNCFDDCSGGHSRPSSKVPPTTSSYSSIVRPPVTINST
jgi:hypothetical protein